jgi:hypothetical protein
MTVSHNIIVSVVQSDRIIRELLGDCIDDLAAALNNYNT